MFPQEEPILIIPCGKKKREGKHRAKELYTGPYFKACLNFAEKFFPKSYFIFSAKYGLLHPDEMVESYDVTFKRKNSSTVKVERLREQLQKFNLIDKSLVVLGGKDYIERLIRALKAPNRLVAPLKGFGLGRQISIMTRSVRLNTIIFPIFWLEK